PEIALLEKDARAQRYHGFIRVESAPPGDDVISLRVREPAGNALPTPDVEIISSTDVEPYAVCFERSSTASPPADGPLTIADDLPIRPFELTLRVPSTWPDDAAHRAVVVILKRFILRYRAFQAYGGHL